MKVKITLDSHEAEWLGQALDIEIPLRDAAWHQSLEYMVRNCILRRVQEQMPADAKPEGALAPTPVDPEVAKLLAAADRATAPTQGVESEPERDAVETPITKAKSESKALLAALHKALEDAS